MIIKMNKNINIQAFLLFPILGLLVGCFLGSDSVLWGFGIFGLFIIFLVSTLILSIVLSFFNKKLPLLFVFIPITLGITLFAFYVSLQICIYVRETKAIKMVSKIEDLKKQKGRYPLNFTELTDVDSSSFTFKSNGEDFEISYIRDGWHYSKYKSITKEWLTGD